MVDPDERQTIFRSIRTLVLDDRGFGSYKTYMEWLGNAACGAVLQ